MSHRDEVRMLMNRSLNMLKHAKICVESGDYDLAAFLAEQFVQLFEHLGLEEVLTRVRERSVDNIGFKEGC